MSLREQIKDQALIVLADYRTCKTDYAWEWEHKARPISEEIAKRMVSNFQILSGKRERTKAIERAEAKIADFLEDVAKRCQDPWAACRTEGTRLEHANEVARILRRK